MSIESFINRARRAAEIDAYFTARPELLVAIKSDAVAIDTLFAVVPSLAAILGKYGLIQEFREEFEGKKPSSVRLLAQVFGHPWHHLNLEQILAGAIRSTQSLDPECDKNGSCGDCDCGEGNDEPISVGLTPEGDLAYTVSDAPLTLEEEAEFIDTLRGSAAEGKTVAEHDPVNKPSHYTSNPSGVEAIELTEKMSFNLGNAFKYVFRRDGKGNTLQDVSKAEWYLKREIGRLEILIDTMPASVPLLVHPSLTNADDRKIQKVIAVESDPNAADYYTYLFNQATLEGPEDLESLHAALDSLRAMIEELKTDCQS